MCVFTEFSDLRFISVTDSRLVVVESTAVVWYVVVTYTK